MSTGTDNTASSHANVFMNDSILGAATSRGYNLFVLGDSYALES